jgi:hypothetical protein
MYTFYYTLYYLSTSGTVVPITAAAAAAVPITAAVVAAIVPMVVEAAEP